MTFFQQMMSKAEAPFGEKEGLSLLVEAIGRVTPDPRQAATLMALATLREVARVNMKERVVIDLLAASVHQVAGEMLTKAGVTLDPGAMS